MPQTPHIERHFTANDSVRDVAIGMSDGLTMPFALAAGLSGAVGSTGPSPRSRPEGSRWAWAGTWQPGATPSTTPCARERPRGIDRVGGSLRPMGTPHRDARPPCPPASADRSILGHSLETLPLRAARVATATPPRSWRAARLSSTSAPCPPCAPARASRRLARSSRRWSPRGTRSPLQAASIASSWPATRRTVGWRTSSVAVVLQVGVDLPSLNVARMLASWTIACPVSELGATPYGSFPAKPLRRPSASAMVPAIGVGSEPFAILSLAAMSWRARSTLASPATGEVSSVSSSACA